MISVVGLQGYDLICASREVDAIIFLNRPSTRYHRELQGCASPTLQYRPYGFRQSIMVAVLPGEQGARV